jgi:hypothetical protein
LDSRNGGMAKRDNLPRSNRGLSGVSESVVEHEEVPKEEAAVKPVRELKKSHRDRNLGIGHR